MNKHLRFLTNSILALQVLLLFCALINFNDYPSWILFTGKLHPLFLHLPISLTLITLPFYFFIKGKTEEDMLLQVFQSLIVYTALLATITAFAGIFLAANGEYDEDILFLHKWIAIAFAVISHIQIYTFNAKSINKKTWMAIQVVATILMIFGSHYGGTLTHGEDFLSFEKEEEIASQFPTIDEKTSVYTAAVSPVISAKCVSCHNSSKRKGGLDMTSINGMLKGGKTGPAWVAGDLDNSLLLERIHLVLDDKKHMPPRGKTQLSADEMMLFTKWIEAGANDKLGYLALQENDSLKLLVDKVRGQATVSKEQTNYSFDAASPSSIAELNNPFRRILPLSINSPALSIKFFLKEKFTISLLEECAAIKKQVIEINLSGMPVDDKIIPILLQFENLEKLNLNNTQISGKNFAELVNLKKLQQLSVTGTNIDINALKNLSKSSIMTIHVWNTKIAANQIAELKHSNASINWDLGYVPDKNELLKLTPPQPSNTDKMIIGDKEKIVLKHPLPGVEIKYTLDGSKPDSINGLTYKEPIPSSQITRIIAIATRPGWISSEASDFTFFQKGIQVDSLRLINKPEEKYNKNSQSVLTDLKKGFPEILNLNWLGYKDQAFKTGFYFNDGNIKSKIVLSAADNTGAYVFPPTKITVWGGDSPKHKKPIGTSSPQMPDKYRSNGVFPYMVSIEKGNYKYIEIEATNIQRLPLWHGGKGEKGWVFVDEVFFY